MRRLELLELPVQPTHIHTGQDGDRGQCIPGFDLVSPPRAEAWYKHDVVSSANDNVPSIIHFILFVFACIATHKWRKSRKQAASGRRNIELQYHRSPAEHMEQQPPAYTPSSAASQGEDPFKDPVHHAGPSEDENPFKDAERGAVKYS